MCFLFKENKERVTTAALEKLQTGMSGVRLR